jgi:hypothetical protein
MIPIGSVEDFLTAMLETNGWHILDSPSLGMSRHGFTFDPKGFWDYDRRVDLAKQAKTIIEQLGRKKEAKTALRIDMIRGTLVFYV